MSTLTANLTPQEVISVAIKMIEHATAVERQIVEQGKKDASAFCHTGIVTEAGDAIKLHISNLKR